MKHQFIAILEGDGETRQEAWENAVLDFGLAPGKPEDYKLVITIVVKGGMIEDVQNLPSGVDYDIVDLDGWWE